MYIILVGVWEWFVDLFNVLYGRSSRRRFCLISQLLKSTITVQTLSNAMAAVRYGYDFSLRAENYSVSYKVIVNKFKRWCVCVCMCMYACMCVCVLVSFPFLFFLFTFLKTVISFRAFTRVMEKPFCYYFSNSFWSW